MVLFFQSVGAALLAVVLGLCLDRQGKDMGLVLTMVASILILTAALSCLEPVLAFLQELQALGNLDEEILQTLLKILGIGLIGELTAQICADAGRASLGKALQFFSGGLILWLSLPCFTLLLNLIQDILGEL